MALAEAAGVVVRRFLVCSRSARLSAGYLTTMMPCRDASAAPAWVAIPCLAAVCSGGGSSGGCRSRC